MPTACPVLPKDAVLHTAARPAPMSLMSRLAQRNLLWGLLFLALMVRIPGLSRPLVGNFATRNVVQAMAARHWVQGESPWWQPTLDCLADGQPALHLVEVPCSAYLSAALWSTFGGTLDAWGRSTAIAWSLLSVGLIYEIVRNRAGSNAAAAAGFVMAISPISVIYGQSFLLEPSVVALTLVAWWGTEQYAEAARPRWLLVIGIALAMLWLTKVYMLALAAPLAWLLWTGENRRSTRDCAAFGSTLLIATLPTTWWCFQVWQLARPEAATAGRVYYSLLSSAAEHGFPHPLLGASGFYLRILADLFTVVLTPVGAMLCLLGVNQVAWRKWWPVGAVMLLLVVAMPRKFQEMNYYHLLFLPAWAGIIGLGWQKLNTPVRGIEHTSPTRKRGGADVEHQATVDLGATSSPPRLRVGLVCFHPRVYAAPLIVTAAMLLSLRYSLRPAFVTPREDRSVIAAAAALRELTALDEKVIASHGTSLDLLYYCDRHGWAMPLNGVDVAQRLEKRHAEGAHWLVVAGASPLVVPELAEAALQEYEVASQGDGYRVYRLDAAGDATRGRSTARTAIPTAPGAK